MATDVLEVMSEESGGNYEVYVPTNVYEKVDYEIYNEYYIQYKNGVFKIIQDEDPRIYDEIGEHDFIEISPDTIDPEDLIELINSLPETLGDLYSTMKADDEDCSKAYSLLQKILEVIQK